jgi:hypothetical protein
MGVTVGLAVTVVVTVGVAVTELLAAGECEALGAADVVGGGVPVAAPDDLVPVLDVLPGDEGTVAVPLATAVGADAADVGPTDGEKIDGTEEEPPPLQADTDPESRTVAAAQPTAVSLALLTFMRPPCIPGWQRL